MTRCTTIRVVLAASCVLAVSGALTLPARAQDPQTPPDTGATGAAQTGGEGEQSETDRQARELYLRGDRLYSEGNYEDAAQAFEESYRLSHRAELKFNLANTYERLGRYEEALAALREYAPEAPEYEHGTISRRIESLEQRLDQQRNQRATGGTGGTASGRVSTETGGAAPIAGYVLIGTGAVAIGLGVVMAVLASDAKSQAEEMCRDGFCPRTAEDSVSDNETFSILADVSFGVGAIAAGLGVVLLLTSGDSAESRPAAGATARLRLGPSGVLVDGRF